MLTLSKEQLDSSIGPLVKSTNTDLVTAIGAIAQAVTSGGDDNPQLQELLVEARKYEQRKNDGWFETVRGVITETKKVAEIGAYLEGLQFGALTNRDLKGDLKPVDDSKVRLIQ